MDLFALGSQLNNISALRAHRQPQAKAGSLWQQRTDSGEYRRMAEENPELASMQEYIDKLHADAASMIEHLNSHRAGSAAEQLQAKLKAGRRLSGSELEQLRKTDPEAYARAKQIEAERAAYERRLKQCRTKEDVQRLRLNAISGIATRVTAIANNPNIPDGKKLELVTHEHMRASAINDATGRFIRSGEYARLPSDAERNAAQRAVRKTENARPNTKRETRPAAVPVQPDPQAGDTDCTEEAAHSPLSEATASEAFGPADTTVSQPGRPEFFPAAAVTKSGKAARTGVQEAEAAVTPKTALRLTDRIRAHTAYRQAAAAAPPRRRRG